LLGFAGAPSAHAAEVAASAPTALSVTVYRNPDRKDGPINLQNLGGFALVTETRTVVAPKSETRLRFEGVVDGIQPESAIISGLPEGVVEKNRDAAVLSPETLLSAAIDSDITLERRSPKTGARTFTRAIVRSAGPDGVIFETPDGLEAYRCSGLGESFSFLRTPNGLGSTPTLSALVRSTGPLRAVVTLSYLTRSFDWAANYVAEISPSGRTLDLTGWITLANGNGVALPSASTQIVAGRLARSPQGPDLELYAPRVIARCWPSGTTSDRPSALGDLREAKGAATDAVLVTALRRRSMSAPAPLAMGPPPPPEDLGDLKLYLVPEPTTVLAHQMKQVRLIDQRGVPFTRTYGADLSAYGSNSIGPATIILRVKNTAQDKLGLPLPSGSVAVLEEGGGRTLLTGEAPVRDTAVGEVLELKIGVSSDIQVRQRRLAVTAAPVAPVRSAPPPRFAQLEEEVEIANARNAPEPFELRLQVNASKLAFSDPPMEIKDGRPLFRLSLPANGVTKVRYCLQN
jgi:hypothetical protein